MLQTLEASYENGQIIFSEKPPISENVKVFVTFTKQKIKNKNLLERPFGTMKGTFKMTEDFNEELEEFKEYR